MKSLIKLLILLISVSLLSRSALAQQTMRLCQNVTTNNVTTCVPIDASHPLKTTGGSGGGVTSINAVAGAFTFSGSGVSCTSTACTFSGSAGGTVPFGTSVSATNPQVNGDPTSGLFSNATSTIQVATGGIEALRVNASQQVMIGTTLPVGSDLLTVNGTAIATALATNGTGWSGFAPVENAAAPTGVVGTDFLYADSALHRLKMLNNNGTADVIVGAATTDTLTNKTFDTAGTGNVFKINGTTISTNTGTGANVLATSPTLVTPTLGVATGTSLALSGNMTALGSVGIGTASPIAGLDVFASGVVAPPVALTISTATFTPSMATGTNFGVTLVHASCPCTLANPTVVNAGQSGVISITQSSTGTDTIGTWGSQYEYVGGTSTIALSTAANTTDLLPYYAVDSSHIIFGTLVKGAAH